MSLPQKRLAPVNIKNQQAVCPHCGSFQMEPVGAISTNCRSCGNYFRLSESRTARKQPAPKITRGTVREVICVKCRTPNRFSDAAMSTQCVRCSNYLDLRDVVIRGASSERIHTYGELSFADGCAFRGFSAEATRIDVLGRVLTKLTATSEIIVGNLAQVAGEMTAPFIHIQKGGVVTVQALTCEKLIVEGLVDVQGPFKANEVSVKSNGGLRLPRVSLKKIEVEKGCAFEGDVELIEVG